MTSISFIGLGLIGGSIAKAIKKYHPEIKLYGHASHASTLQDAFNDEVISNRDFLPLEELAKSDIIFLCAPVGNNIEYLCKLAPIVPKTTLITDIGSVKGGIESKAKMLGLSSQFIGGHPMTGSEKDGYSNSLAMLLENAYYILTENDEIDPKRFKEFAGFISSLGAITLKASPKLHDHATAAISHLPHIIAASLVKYVHDCDTDDGFMRTIAAGGFKDITRIASSSPVMWQNICMDNKDELLATLSSYEDTLRFAKKLINDGDPDKLNSFFQESKDYRDSMPIPKGSILPQTYDFFLDLEDEAGQIASVATTLALANISIKNIGIIHNREFEDGVLHLELYDNNSRTEATELLEKRGYRVHHRS